MNEMNKFEIADDELDAVVGGYGVGDTVRIKSGKVAYCSTCGKQLTDYYATITGVRGVLNGKTVYWITRQCCGHKSSEIETAFVG